MQNDLQKIVFCVALALAGVLCVAAEAPQGDLGPLPDFRLLDQSGRSHTIRRYADASAVVIMAAPKEDAAAQGKLAEFAALAKSHADKQIFFFVVTPDAEAGPLAKAADGVPVLLDDAQVVLPAIGLDHAYECLVAEAAHWKVLYRGGLSGESGAPGLAGALDALAAGTLQGTTEPATGPALALQAAPQNVSYAKEVAPILSARCVTCHSDGNIGPFSMDSHGTVAGHAKMMAETVRNGRMPPWEADPRYGHFSNALALTAPEKRTLLAWLNAGAPKDGEADPLKEVKAPTPTDWRLGTPDLVIKLPEAQQIPAEGQIDYKYYEMPLDLPAGTWIKGTEIRITQPQVMHHVLVYMRQEGQDIDFTQEYIASYVPGNDPGLFPEGTGKPVPEHAKLLFQLHYTPNGRAVTDNPELGIYLCKDKPAHEMFLGSAVNRRFVVPPNATETEASARFTAPEDILVYSLSPHMHYRGRRMSFEAVYPTGEHEMLLSVPDYNFYWQHSYHLAEPKRLPKGTVINVAGAWDNSKRNPINPDPSRSLDWGEQSTDEMFIGSVLYRAAD